VASNLACNCFGYPTRYCKLDEDGYPNGICQDQGVAGDSCDGDQATATCDINNSMCQEILNVV